MNKKNIFFSLCILTASSTLASEMMSAVWQGNQEGIGPVSGAVEEPGIPAANFGEPARFMGHGPAVFPTHGEGEFIPEHHLPGEEPGIRKFTPSHNPRPFMGHGPAVFHPGGEGFDRPNRLPYHRPQVSLEKRITHVITVLRDLFEETHNEIFNQCIEMLKSYKPQHTPMVPRGPMLGQMQFTVTTDEHGCMHRTGTNGSGYKWVTVIKCPTKELCEEFNCGVTQIIAPAWPHTHAHSKHDEIRKETRK